ncbi:MAG: hypothetical protein WC508_06265, partial [Patescibacteria group bacterium]
APAPVRLARLAARDQHRKGADVKERFGLTQGFELPYFPQHWHRITCFVDNSVDSLQVMDPLPHQFALATDGIPC